MKRAHQWQRASVILATLLCACATPPQHEPAPIAPIADGTLGLGASAVAPAGPAWWQAFGDAQLDRLIQQATADSRGADRRGALR
jgi:outer membrane protein TolC